MRLPAEIFGDVVVVHTPEEIGREQADLLTSTLTSLEKANVVVDVDGTESIGSAGLEALLDAQETFRRRGGDVKISTSNSVNKKILEITRLDQQIEVFGSVLEAVKSFV